MRLTLISLSLLVTLALLGCFNNGSDESVSRLEPVLTTPAPSASAETTLTPEPAVIPSSQPTGAAFTPAATPELPTTVLLGTTPGPAAASDASGNEYDFSAVSAGYRHTCGLRSNGTVLCWGDGREGETEPPEATFTSISAGHGYTCGIETDGSASCWGIWGISYGMPVFETSTHRRPESPAGVFKSISTGGAHACGIKADDTLVCWGENRVSTGDFAEHTGQATPPPGTFRSVSAVGAHTCGLTTDNLAVCWGAGYEGPTSPVQGQFLSVSAGDIHSCAVRIDGIIACWGRDLGYRTLGLQTNIICGVLPNRATVCPGDDGTTYWPHCALIGSITTTITVRSILAEMFRMGRQCAGTLMKRRLSARRPGRLPRSAPATTARVGSCPMEP